MKSLFNTPASQILNNARNFPFYECWICSEWKENGFANIILARLQPDKKIIAGVFLVDLFCLGVKDSFHLVNCSITKYNETIEKFSQQVTMQKCPVELAHSIIYSAIDFAHGIGFSPHPDYQQTKLILEPRENIKLSKIKCGLGGIPNFVAGPSDDVDAILATLNRNVGQGNYHYIIPD